MDWLKSLLEKHTKDGKLDLEAFMKKFNTEFPKHAVPKETYNALAETKKTLENDIKERDKQLEELKKVDAAGLKAEIERLQGENKSAKEKYEADMKDLTLTNAIKLAIAGKVHDEGLVTSLFDKSKLILSEDGKIAGLDEQLKNLKDTKKFLFKEETPAGTGGSKGNGIKGKDDDNKDSIGKKLAEHATNQVGALEKSQDLYFR